MPYVKDPDYYTRGVGAIQAVDKVKARSRGRVRQQLERGRMSQRIDRKRLALVARPMGLGAISRVGMNLANPVLYGKPGGIDSPGTGIIMNPAMPPRRGSSGNGGLLLAAQASSNPASIFTLAAQVAGGGTKATTDPKSPYRGNANPVNNPVNNPPTSVTTDPVFGVQVGPPAPTDTSGGSSGSGSSVGTSTGGGTPTPGSGGGGGGGGELDLTPDDPTLDLSASSFSSFIAQHKTGLLVGGAALLALYLYKRKKRR